MSTNDVTGDRLVTKPATDNYLDNYDRIFKQERKSVVLTNEEYNRLLDEAEEEYLKDKCKL